MATSLEVSKKESHILNVRIKYLPYDEYVVKIGPVDPGVICMKRLF